MNEQMQTLVAMLDQSQWHEPHVIHSKQARLFHALMTHACETVPLYKEHYSHLLNKHGSNISAYPVLTRDLIQQAKDGLSSQHIPASHGQLYPQTTSGSTGKAVTVIGTDFTRLFYDALMLREHAWHKRDVMKKLVSIRWGKRGLGDAPLGHAQSTWGPPINQYMATGPSVFINVACDTRSQIDALLMHEPHYILSYPSQLAALAQYCIKMNIALPHLEEVRTTGEAFHPAYTQVIQQAWPDVKITDVYSSVEIGNIAQQCPEYRNYHVNAESVLLEIVDKDNKPCAIGEPGRVLVTSLLNFATPFIRYDIGDYAEWGQDCKCGRKLPVINKILGRKRNRLFYANGDSSFPYFGEREEFREIVTGIRKFQFIQHTLHDIEIKLVISEKLSLTQEEQFKTLVQKNLSYPFNIMITYHEHIPLGPTGKYEEFMSLVDQ